MHGSAYHNSNTLITQVRKLHCGGSSGGEPVSAAVPPVSSCPRWRRRCGSACSPGGRGSAGGCGPRRQPQALLRRRATLPAARAGQRGQARGMLPVEWVVPVLWYGTSKTSCTCGKYGTSKTPVGDESRADTWSRKFEVISNMGESFKQRFPENVRFLLSVRHSKC